MQHIRRRLSRFTVGLTTAVTIVLVTCGGLARLHAQNNGRSDTADMKRLMQLKRDVAMGSQSLDSNAGELSKYYTERLKTMAMDRAEMLSIRLEIMNDLRTSRSDAFRQFVTAELLKPKGIGQVILEHPRVSLAAKVNMMLLLGQLNDSEGNLRAGVPPTPSVSARKIMLAHVDNAKQDDSVKIAALVGLMRHVETSPETARDVLGSMLRLVSAQPPEGHADGHYWLKKQAAEILGRIGQDNNEGVVTVALDAIVRDARAPRSVRCAAIEALGQIRPPQTAKVNLQETVQTVGNFALESFRAEIGRLEAWEAEQTQALGRFAEPPRAVGDDQNEEDGPDKEVIQITQRRLGHELNCILRGISTKSRGLAALAASPEEQRTLEALVAPLQSTLNSLDEKSLVLQDLKTKLTTQADQLARLVNAGAAPAAPQPQDEPAVQDQNNPFAAL